jgi:hypothetical protein
MLQGQVRTAALGCPRALGPITRPCERIAESWSSFAPDNRVRLSPHGGDGSPLRDGSMEDSVGTTVGAVRG